MDFRVTRSCQALTGIRSARTRPLYPAQFCVSGVALHPTDYARYWQCY